MPNYVEAARIETKLMVEFLPSDRPDPSDAAWVRNALSGPHPAGIRALEEVQERYGVGNVTTGNALDPSPSDLEAWSYARRTDPGTVLVGIYVRKSE